MAQLRAKQIKLAAAGDLLIGGTGGNGSVLTKGTAGQVLKVLTGGALGYEKAAASETTIAAITGIVATDVQGALAELHGDVEAVAGDLTTNIATLTGRLDALGDGSIDDLEAEVNAIETAVGLAADGAFDNTGYAGSTHTGVADVAANTVKAKVLAVDAALAAHELATAAAIGEVTEDVTDLGTAVSGHVATLTDLITAEEDRAEAEEAAIRTDFAAADTLNTNAIAAEVTRATAAEDAIALTLASEETVRAAADTAIKQGAGLDINGDYVVPTGTTYLGDTENLAEADIALDSAIKVLADELEALAGGEGGSSISSLQGEVDLIEAGLGFDAETGSKPSFLSTNYIDAADNLNLAVEKLDTQAKSANDAINAANVRIDALGAAFNYTGVIAGGADEETANDFSGLPAGGKDAGDYYKVTTGGYFKVGAGAAFKVNVGDGLVFNTTGGVDIIDNTNANVLAGANIAVTGNTDTGFTVALDGIVPAANGGTGKAALEDVTSTTGAITLSAGAAGSVVNAFALTFNPDAVNFADLAGVNAPGVADQDKFLKWTSTGLAYVTAEEMGTTIAVEEDFMPTAAANVSFVLTKTPQGDVAVYVNGVKIKKAGYTVNAGTKTVTLVDSANGYSYEDSDTISVSYNAFPALA